jgi:antitoxin component YwqK of YwqJK toxin-antitoxin module
MKKYYQILDLEEGASKAEIEKRCQELLKEYDPKDNDNQEFFKEEYEKVQEAYKALITSALLKSPDKKPKIKSVHTESSTDEDEAKEGENTRVDAQKVPALRAFFSKKNILLILIVLGVLVAILIKIGYSQGRVLMDDLTDKGTKQSPTMYYEGALFNGVSFDVYSNGQLKFEANYKDGTRDGLAKGWHSNGQLRSEANYKDGKKDGLQKWWYKNGQLHLEFHYRYGEKDGLFKTWYESGQLKLERHYRDGEEDGLFKTWYESGQLETILNYKDGEYDGLYQRWYENGKLQFTVKYKNGFNQG